MCRLSCLLSLFASFWLLGAGSLVCAQNESSSSEAPLAFEVPALTELKIQRSSRTDVPETVTVETAEIPKELPRILDQTGAERLMRNEGITLQWISWEERGPAWVAVTQSGHWLLLAGQEDGEGAIMDMEGFITEIGKDYFIYEGTIRIRATPDKERACGATKTWLFEVTQNRSYYRLREFEWWDYLTDYIDIYFPPALR